jgi:hypothetical protein
LVDQSHCSGARTVLRLKSAIWISAFLRQREIGGNYGAVIKKGADEAGAVYVVVNHLDGTYDLLGPAPGSAYNEEGERRFVKEIAAPAEWPSVSAVIDRRRKADSDIWVIEIEDRSGLGGLDVTTI